MFEFAGNTGQPIMEGLEFIDLEREFPIGTCELKNLYSAIFICFKLRFSLYPGHVWEGGRHNETQELARA